MGRKGGEEVRRRFGFGVESSLRPRGSQRKPWEAWGTDSRSLCFPRGNAIGSMPPLPKTDKNPRMKAELLPAAQKTGRGDHK